MAQTRISALPTKSTVDNADLIPIVDSVTGLTKKVTKSVFGASLASATSGWNSLGYAPNAVTYNGNRSYSMVFNGVDLTGVISPGMKMMSTRTVAAPTQCTSLNGTTQYWSKTSPAGMTFTNNFVVSAWIRLSSYPSVNGAIASRYNGTSGWTLQVDNSGVLHLYGLNAGGSNFKGVKSYQSLPLNKWIHVTAQLDMVTATNTATTNYIMLDALDVPAAIETGGTNPTALIQAGNLEIGTANATSFFPGKIAQVAIYSAKVTQATIQASISQGLAGTETSLVSAYAFNGNANDLNANANHLTSNGGAAATVADGPFGGQANNTRSSSLDCGIIESVTFSVNSTVSVRASEICAFPTSGGISSVSYSSSSTPFGLPGDLAQVVGRRLMYIPVGATLSTSATSETQFQPVTNFPITVPQNCYQLKFGLFNPSANDSGGILVFKAHNGVIATTTNELVQYNQNNSNNGLSFSASFPVVPGEVLSINVGWSVTAGTGTWSPGGANRQAPALWIETA